MNEILIEYILYFIICIPLLYLLRFAWGTMEENIAYVFEQELFRIRDEIYDLILENEASLQEHSTKNFVGYIHFLIRMARSSELREEMIEFLFQGEFEQKAEADFLQDDRYKKYIPIIGMNICGLLSMKIWTRYFFKNIFMFLFFVLFSISKKIKRIEEDLIKSLGNDGQPDNFIKRLFLEKFKGMFQPLLIQYEKSKNCNRLQYA